jgi:hypothetical protein
VCRSGHHLAGLEDALAEKRIRIQSRLLCEGFECFLNGREKDVAAHQASCSRARIPWEVPFARWSIWPMLPSSMPTPPRGLYEVLITAALEARLGEPDGRSEVRRAELREADAADRIAFHLAQVVERAVSSFDRKDRVEKGIALARKLIEDIGAVTESLACEGPVSPGAVLRAVVCRLPDGTSEMISDR